MGCARSFPAQTSDVSYSRPSFRPKFIGLSASV
jgi:hypothetical protein